MQNQLHLHRSKTRPHMESVPRGHATFHALTAVMESHTSFQSHLPPVFPTEYGVHGGFPNPSSTPNSVKCDAYCILINDLRAWNTLIRSLRSTENKHVTLQSSFDGSPTLGLVRTWHGLSVRCTPYFVLCTKYSKRRYQHAARA